MASLPASTSAAPAAPKRWSRARRRDQLLNTAAEVLVTKGLAAVTMEGVAAQAGVSKALPYTHFENATDMVRALRDRELDHMRDRINGAAEEAEGYEPTIAAAVHAYFSVMRDRGAVLAAAMRSLPMDGHEASERENPAFYAPMFEQEMGLSPELARLTSSIFVSAAPGAVAEWIRRGTRRATAEATLVRVIMAGAAAIAAAEDDGTLPIARPE